MADTYTVVMPSVTEVTLTPNPATINKALSVTVTVTEITKILYAEDARCGAAVCGEG